MAPRQQNRFWRICRTYFRGFRITVWLVILAILGSLLYLNQVGLPRWAKEPILSALRDRGVDLRFSRLRLRFDQGIVAEDVRFERPDEPASPHLALREVQVRLNFRELLHLRLQIEGLMLRQGRLVWHLADTNNTPHELSVDRIQSELRFLPDDLWALDQFKADFAGAHIQLSGIVTNASAVRDWSFLQGTQPSTAGLGVWSKRIEDLSREINRIHFSTPPDLRLDIRGDARDLQSFGVLILVAAQGADTPWGTVDRGRLAARLFAADTNRISHAQLNLEAASARTPWGAITNFLMEIQLGSLDNQTNLMRGQIKLSAAGVKTEWAEGINARINANWIHSITNPIPVSAQGRISCDFARTPWVTARQVRVEGQFDLPPSNSIVADPAWAWWTSLEPYQLGMNVQAADLRYSNVVIDTVACGVNWHSPQLLVSNVDLGLYRGRMTAHGGLDVATRAVDAVLGWNCDPQEVLAALPWGVPAWLGRFTWKRAPEVKADLRAVLPVWTNSHPDWQAEVKPTVELQGEFNLDQPATYLGLQFLAARSSFSYSNLCWDVPDLTLTRPEGQLTAAYRADERTREFSARFTSTLDPQIARALLDEDAQQPFELFTLTQPPRIEAELWGVYHEPARTGFKGRVGLTNFAFRGESIAEVQAALDYTNGALRVINPRILRGGSEEARAEGLTVDFRELVIYLTNGYSTADPMFVARAIGTNVVQAISPYQFLRPPIARVNGIIPLHGEEQADLHFDLEGGPFHWWKFNVSQISGQVHWVGLHVNLTNMVIDFYGGRAAGSAAFDFPHGAGTDFYFALAATNLSLQPLVADLATPGNRLEGQVSGKVIVTKASAESWQSVFGYGDASLRDGLIWEIPLFGLFTPVLNGISPGLGNSRATAGTCTFTITNGVIRSEDLDIRCTGMRLKYRGTVDLASQLHARVEAEPLRDVWMVGPLVSTVFWPVTKFFEYKVSGTLGDPKLEPVFFIPRLMMIPLHPFRTLKGLFQEESDPLQFSPLPPGN